MRRKMAVLSSRDSSSSPSDLDARENNQCKLSSRRIGGISRLQWTRLVPPRTEGWRRLPRKTQGKRERGSSEVTLTDEVRKGCEQRSSCAGQIKMRRNNILYVKRGRTRVNVKNGKMLELLYLCQAFWRRWKRPGSDSKTTGHKFPNSSCGASVL